MDPTNLLTEPVFRVETSTGARTLSLPDVLAALGADTVEDFSALAPYQEAAWHAFLVQLAAFTADRLGALPDTADTWREALLRLTDDDADPWRLVVADLKRPAFLQPPSESGDAADYKREFEAPDELDVLVTAKNFDLKASRLKRARLEHWVYALVSAQTSQGFSGRGNYGVTRMNSGFGNRPQVAFCDSPRWGRRWQADLATHAARIDNVVSDHGYDRAGAGLTWLLTWDGTHSVDPRSLHPWYIEASRRLRAFGGPAGPRIRMAATTSARLQIASGDTGDIWTPIQVDKEGRKALTVVSSGFRAEQQVALLYISEGLERPAAMTEGSGTAPRLLMASALARGQGKTEGLHTVYLTVPGQHKRLRRGPDGEPVGPKRARAALLDLNTMKLRVLSFSLSLLLSGGEAQRKDERVYRWADAFQRAAEAELFPVLHAHLDDDEDTATRAWHERLLALARHTLEDAIASAPIPSARRRRAIAAADTAFGATLRKHFSNTVGATHDHHQQP